MAMTQTNELYIHICADEKRKAHRQLMMNTRRQPLWLEWRTKIHSLPASVPARYMLHFIIAMRNGYVHVPCTCTQEREFICRMCGESLGFHVSLVSTLTCVDEIYDASVGERDRSARVQPFITDVKSSMPASVVLSSCEYKLNSGHIYRLH